MQRKKTKSTQPRKVKAPITPKKRGVRPGKKEAARPQRKKTPALLPPYGQYLSEIHQFPLLTKGEEYRLAVEFYESKDPRIAQTLVTANLRFVVKIAQEYANYGIKIMDLVQEGNIGLMRAVKTFNPYKDVRLITYAVWWIRAYIQEYIQRNWSMVKFGTTQAQRKLFYKLNQEKRKLDLLGLPTNVKLLSQKLSVREDEVTEMEKRLSARDLSLDAPATTEGSARIGDFISSDSSISAEERLLTEQGAALFKKHLEEFKQTLTARDKDILEQRLLADQPLTLEEIGKNHGVTKERVRQLENEIKKKLKVFLLEKDPSYKI